MKAPLAVAILGAIALLAAGAGIYQLASRDSDISALKYGYWCGYNWGLHDAANKLRPGTLAKPDVAKCNKLHELITN